jgi:hypothetical protein
MVVEMNFRKLKRTLEQLANEDHCSLCGAQHPHNSPFYGGLTHQGKVALVGDCCADQLQEVIMGGVYMHPAWAKFPGEIVQ